VAVTALRGSVSDGLGSHPANVADRKGG